MNLAIVLYINIFVSMCTCSTALYLILMQSYLGQCFFKNVLKICLYMQLINAAYYARTLWIHTGVMYSAKKWTLSILDLVQRNLLLLVYFHEEYDENQQRALMIAECGRHFFHWSSQTPNYFWILPSQNSEQNARFQQPRVIILKA